MANRIVTFAL